MKAGSWSLRRFRRWSPTVLRVPDTDPKSALDCGTPAGLTRHAFLTILALMERVSASVKTFKYRFKVGGRVVHYGITTDLKRRGREHRQRWPDGVIQQVGRPTSHRDAWEWERQQAFPGSATAV